MIKAKVSYIKERKSIDDITKKKKERDTFPRIGKLIIFNTLIAFFKDYICTFTYKILVNLFMSFVIVFI